MKNIRIKIDECNDSMFDYPCVDSNSLYLKGKKVSIFANNQIVDKTWFERLGADVVINPSPEGTCCSNIGIILPDNDYNDDENGYYQVLEYYINKLQLLIKTVKDLPGFKHLIILLPSKSDECSTSYVRMAYYAITGLVKGLASMYGTYGVFINAIILNEADPQKNLQDRLLLLASNNSCNIVGQVFKL